MFILNALISSIPSISYNHAKTRPLSPFFRSVMASSKVATPIYFIPIRLNIFAISINP